MKLPKQNMLYSSNMECSHLKQKATMIFQCSHILKENKTKQNVLNWNIRENPQVSPPHC